MFPQILFMVVALSTMLLPIAASEDFTIGNNRYFLSHPVKKNWYEAYRYCLSQCMVLVSINDKYENNRILSIIKDPAYINDPEPHYWTSGTDDGSEGHFYWASNGHDLRFTDYADGQPDNNGGHENCVEIRGEFGFKWNDHFCSDEKYFICRNPVWLPIPHEDKLVLAANATKGYTHVSLFGNK